MWRADAHLLLLFSIEHVLELEFMQSIATKIVCMKCARWYRTCLVGGRGGCEYTATLGGLFPAFTNLSSSSKFICSIAAIESISSLCCCPTMRPIRKPGFYAAFSKVSQPAKRQKLQHSQTYPQHDVWGGSLQPLIDFDNEEWEDEWKDDTRSDLVCYSSASVVFDISADFHRISTYKDSQTGSIDFRATTTTIPRRSPNYHLQISRTY